jgi:hypothetical protein
MVGSAAVWIHAGNTQRVFDDYAIFFMLQLAMLKVVDMTLMLHGRVAATWTVLMVGGFLGVLGVAHFSILCCL